jgi:hypothetical protein
MTLQEAKDQIAHKYGYENWAELFIYMSCETQMQYLEESAIVYAQSKWDEACEEQRNKCCEEYMAIDVYDHTNKFETIDREMNAIKFAPKPEFNP